MTVLVTRIKRYYGLSTDTKPTLAQGDAGSSFYETDTGDTYVWSGSAWVLVSPCTWLNNIVCNNDQVVCNADEVVFNC